MNSKESGQFTGDGACAGFNIGLQWTTSGLSPILSKQSRNKHRDPTRAVAEPLCTVFTPISKVTNQLFHFFLYHQAVVCLLLEETSGVRCVQCISFAAHAAGQRLLWLRVPPAPAKGLVYAVTNLSPSSRGTTGQDKDLPFQISQSFSHLVNDSQESRSELQLRFGLFFVKALPVLQPLGWDTLPCIPHLGLFYPSCDPRSGSGSGQVSPRARCLGRKSEGLGKATHWLLRSFSCFSRLVAGR